MGICISHGADGAAIVETLIGPLPPGSLCNASADRGCVEVHARFERATQVVVVITPDWAATKWPTIETYLAERRVDVVAFLAKLALIDLSGGTSVPTLLRPLLKSGDGFAGARTLELGPLADFVVSAAGMPSARPVTDKPPGGNRNVAKGEVFVLGHPGSGKSGFCAALKARLMERGIPAVKIDAYAYLQVLFRIAQLRRDTTRFAADALSEFVIKDPSVFDESVALVRRRLLARHSWASGVTVVELAFSEGEALANAIEACPGSMIVHIEASLEDCERRNAARGALLRSTIRSATSSEEAFDRDPDVHHVPSSYYDRYAADPARWEDAPSRLSKRFADRYHRLENRGGDPRTYSASCQTFIETVLLPFFKDKG